MYRYVKRITFPQVCTVFLRLFMCAIYQILKDKNVNIELAIVLVMYICRDRSDKKL